MPGCLRPGQGQLLLGAALLRSTLGTNFINLNRVMDFTGIHENEITFLENYLRQICAMRRFCVLDRSCHGPVSTYLHERIGRA